MSTAVPTQQTFLDAWEPTPRPAPIVQTVVEPSVEQTGVQPSIGAPAATLGAAPSVDPEMQLARDQSFLAAVRGSADHVFANTGEELRFAERVNVIRRLYEGESSDRPFTMAVSMGKDSTLVASLVWIALTQVPPEDRQRPVAVVSTDTQVENPLMAKWQTENLLAMGREARAQGLPIQVHHLQPVAEQAFLVQVIGRGYAPPRRDFRWCTDRLKIQPNTEAMRRVAGGTDNSLLFLGTRKDESAARRANMVNAEAAGRTRAFISPNMTLGGRAEVCTPIEDWSTTEVWNGLMAWQSGRLPWGTSAMWLFDAYDRAAANGECGLVVDKESACGKAGRFGCHTCTLVDVDSTMQNLVKTIHPELRILNALRNELRDFERERIPVRRDETGRIRDHVDLKTGAYERHPDEPEAPRRDIRRKRHLVNGETIWKVDIEDQRTAQTDVGTPAGFHIPGSLTKPWCEYFLRRYLEAGVSLQRTADAALDGSDRTIDRGWFTFLRSYEVLPVEQIHAIRDIWVNQRYWWDDRAPEIYREVTGQRLPG